MIGPNLLRNTRIINLEQNQIGPEGIKHLSKHLTEKI